MSSQIDVQDSVKHGRWVISVREMEAAGLGDEVIELFRTKPDDTLLKLSAAAFRVRGFQIFGAVSLVVLNLPV